MGLDRFGGHSKRPGNLLVGLSFRNEFDNGALALGKNGFLPASTAVTVGKPALCVIRPEEPFQKDPMLRAKIFLRGGQQITEFARPFPNETDCPRFRRPTQNLVQDLESPAAASGEKGDIGQIEPGAKRAMAIV